MLPGEENFQSNILVGHSHPRCPEPCGWPPEGSARGCGHFLAPCNTYLVTLLFSVTWIKGCCLVLRLWMALLTGSERDTLFLARDGWWAGQDYWVGSASARASTAHMEPSSPAPRPGRSWALEGSGVCCEGDCVYTCAAGTATLRYHIICARNSRESYSLGWERAFHWATGTTCKLGCSLSSNAHLLLLAWAFCCTNCLDSCILDKWIQELQPIFHQLLVWRDNHFSGARKVVCTETRCSCLLGWFQWLLSGYFKP